MNLDYLDKIKNVEAPPFLFTRIQAKIENLKNNRLGKKTAWALGLSFLILICLNIGLIIKTQENAKDSSQYALSINLKTNNNLYNE